MSQRAQDMLERIVRTDFRLNQTGEGGTAAWGLSRTALQQIARVTGPATVSAETGSGLSTLLFGALAAEHHCFTLLDQDREKLIAAAERLDLTLRNVHFHVGDSAVTLPATDLPDLNIAVVDGGHAFPLPVLDWYYLTRSLSDGGLILIDDTWIPTVRILSTFLDLEPSWKVAARDGRSSWYRRQRPPATPSLYPDAWDLQGLNENVGRHFASMQALSTGPALRRSVLHPVLLLRRELGMVLSHTKQLVTRSRAFDSLGE